MFKRFPTEFSPANWRTTVQRMPSTRSYAVSIRDGVIGHSQTMNVSDGVTCVALSHDGKRVAILSRAGRLSVRDRETGIEIDSVVLWAQPAVPGVMRSVIGIVSFAILFYFCRRKLSPLVEPCPLHRPLNYPQVRDQ